jgi:hypothetical protein
VCPARAVNVLVTDSGADPDVLAGFTELGVRVITA